MLVMNERENLPLAAEVKSDALVRMEDPAELIEEVAEENQPASSDEASSVARPLSDVEPARTVDHRE